MKHGEKHGKRTSKLEKILRRPIALMMTVMMCASLMSVSAFAEEDVSDEIEEEPVQIAAEEEEAAVSEEEPEAEASEEETEPAADAEEETEPAAEADEAEEAEDEEDALVSQSIKASIYTGSTYLIGKNDGNGTDITLEGKMPEGAVAKAYPVDVEIEGIEVLAAYDITIFDQDGEEYQPADGAITVTIQNEAIQEAVKENSDLSVFHMEDKKAEPEKVAIKSEGRNGSVKFDAKKFSIYVVGENGELIDENGDEVEAYTVNFYEWVYGDEEDSDDVNPIATEKVVGDDVLNEPEVPEIEHHVFDGWFTVEQDAYNEHPGYQFDFSKTVQDNLDSWTDYTVGEGNVISLYSDYDPIYYVYYMTEEKYDDQGNPDESAIFFTDEYYEGNLILDTTSAESLYSASHITTSQAVESWYYYDDNGDRQTIASGATITDNLTLYPVVTDAIWIYFVMGDEAGENVEALDPIYILASAEEIGELPTPEMGGYDFAGWYTADEEEVTSDSNPQDLVDEQTGWITLYAHWTPANVAYTVNIWRQKATDGQEGINQKTVQNGEEYSTYIQYYDYAESITVSAEDSLLKTGDTNIETSQFGSTTSGTGPWQTTTENWTTWTGYGWTTGNNGSDGTGDYVGFEYNTTRTLNDLATITVKADGSTIFNIFYDRVTVTYNFTRNNQTTTYTGLYDTNFTEWPDPGTNTQWRYRTSSGSSSNSYTGMSFLAKFTLTENYDNRSNVVNFTTNSTSYSSTLYYYLEVTNPDTQVNDSSQTRTINGTTYVLDQTFTFGWDYSGAGQAGISFNITDKYIGYTAVGFNTSNQNSYNQITSNNNPVSLSNNGTLYIYNNAIEYNIDLYSNHDGEQLIDTIKFKYGQDLTSYELPTELDAEEYGPAYYYHFTGTWYEDPSFSAEFVKPSTMPNYNLVAYADWELNEVEVTFQSYVESDLYDVLVNLYGVDAVSIVSNGDNDEDGNPLWAYSIIVTAGDELNYDLDDGLESKVEDHDYEYAGWLNTDTNKVFNFLSKVYTDTTLQVFWIEEEVIYHIQYNMNLEGDDSAVLGHSHESTSWAEVRELTDVFENADDSDFICWNTEPDGSGTNYYPEDDLDFTKVTAEAVYDDEGEFLYYVYNLYAIWAEEKTATLDLEYNYPTGYEPDDEKTNEVITGANLENVELSEDYNPSVIKIEITDESGNVKTYKFAGWAYDEDAEEADIPVGTTVAVDNVNEENNVLYAVWLEVVPGWEVEKKLTNSGSGEGGAFKAGETATFTITVTNTSDETIALIEVTEVLEGATFVAGEGYTVSDDGIVATITDLVAGASVEIQATYTVTAEDIESGEELANSITTEGGDPDDPIPGPGDEEPIPTEDQNPSLSVEKTADVAEGEVAELGQEITYTIVVTNDGNVTLTDITVTDNKTGLNETIESLAPGEDATFTTTYVVTEEDILAGSIENVATATAPNPNYDPDDPDSPANIEGEGEEEVTTEDKNPHLTITKEATSEPENGETYALGEEITWKVTVTNDGNLTISGITVTDELTGDTWTIDSLAPGESTTFETAPYTVTEADIIKGYVANEATATGTSPDPENPDTPVEPGTDEEPTDDENPHLTVSKVVDSTPANGTAYDLGEEIIWIITVTNDGNLTISDIVVTDELTGDTWEVEGTLAPGESTTFTASHVVNEADIEAGDVYNEATATGTSPDPENPDTPVVPGDDDEPTVTPGPSLYVDKTADVEDGEEVVLGQEITYTIYVLNNGNITLTGITVTDDLTGESWTIDSLAPGASETFTTTYVVTEADIIAGSIENVAIATAPNPEYDPDDPNSPENIEGEGEEEVTTEDKDPHITIAKEATSTPENGEAYTVGETITWDVTVTNDGNLTITDIVVTDELTRDTWEIASLAPGKSETFEASYTVTADDMENGSVINEAELTSGKSSDPENPDDVPSKPGTDEQPIEKEEFFDLEEKIVPGNDDEKNPDSWVTEESVNEYEGIEIEMSTTLPKVSGTKLSEDGYVLTFYNKLDSGLKLYGDDSDDYIFIVDIDGTPIDPEYYSISIEGTDDYTFSVSVNLYALYGEIITDDMLGTSTIRVFFYVDLEDVDEDDIQNVYYSTAWYDITNSDGEIIYTTDTDEGRRMVDVYTYELIVNKYDTETDEPLADATFGIFKDEDATNAVTRGNEDLIAVTDENGQAKFIGIAADTYLKELAAPDGYELNQEIQKISTDDAENHVIEISVGNTPISDDANNPQTPKKSSNIELGSWVAVGDEIVYTIEYYNNNTEAVDVVITDTLDKGLDFVSASDGGVYDAKTRTVTWTITDAPSHETGSVTLTAKVNATAASESSIQNTASVKIGDAEAVESNTLGITVATSGNGGNGGNGAPKTADTNNLALWLTLLFASIAVLLVGSRMRRFS